MFHFKNSLGVLLSLTLVFGFVGAGNAFAQPKDITELVVKSSFTTEPRPPADKPTEADGDTSKSGTKQVVNPYFENLAQPDRAQLRRLDQANRLLQAGRYPEAAQLFATILESNSDALMSQMVDETLVEKAKLPAKSNAKSTNQTTPKTPQERALAHLFPRVAHLTLRKKVADEIQSLPPSGKQAYSMHCEAIAKRLLEHAVETGSMEEVQQVVKKYSATNIGKQAAFILGTAQYEDGHFGSAWFTLQSLGSDPATADEFEPALSVTLAMIEVHFGMLDEAKETLNRFLSRFPKPSIQLYGTPRWTPQSVDEMLAKLREFQAAERSCAAWVEQTGWLLGWGTKNQNAETQATKPILDEVWSVSTRLSANTENMARYLSRLVKWDKNIVYLPTAQPLLVDHYLIIRGISEITAIDTQTGKIVWAESPAEYRLPDEVKRISPFSVQRNPLLNVGALRLFSWHDRVSHSLSSDGQAVYAIEDLSLMPFQRYGGQQRVLPFNLNGQILEHPLSRPGSTLTARDVKTGQILWQTGAFPYNQKLFDDMVPSIKAATKERAITIRRLTNRNEKPADEGAEKNAEKNETKKNVKETPEEIEQQFLSETWFLGAPLPISDRLYILGENGGTIRLFVLDSKTGRLILQQPLAQTTKAFETDSHRRYFGLIPTAQDGILLCPTGMRLVVAVDLTTGSPLWAYSYQDDPKADSRSNQGAMGNADYAYYNLSQGDNATFRTVFASTGWQAPRIIIEGRHVIVAPPEVPQLICLDLLTGEPIWIKEFANREEILYVACLYDEKVFVVTPCSMNAYQLATGLPAWEEVLPAPEQNAVNITIAGSGVTTRRTSTQNRTDREIPSEDLSAVKKTRIALSSQTRYPSGIGVRNDSRYFLPLSDGTLAVVSLDSGAVEWVTPMGTVQQNSDTAPANDATNGGSKNYAAKSGEMLGNLVGIKGRFYSQTPFKTSCFDQKEALQSDTNRRLQSQPDDPQGVLQLGRLKVAEGQRDEAIGLFQKACLLQFNAQTLTLLRETLLDGIRSDYQKWKGEREKLEALAVFPEDLATILFVLAQQSLQAEEYDTFFDVSRKAILLDTCFPVFVEAKPEVTSRLYLAIAWLMEQKLTETSDSKNDFEGYASRFAEELYAEVIRSSGISTDTTIEQLMVGHPLMDRHSFSPAWWAEEEDVSHLKKPVINRQRLVCEFLRSLPGAERREQALLDTYFAAKEYLAAELLINPVRNRKSEAVGRIGTETLTEWLRLAQLAEKNNLIADAVYYYRLVSDISDSPATNENEWSVIQEAAQKGLSRPQLHDYQEREKASLQWPTGFVRIPEDAAQAVSPATPRAQMIGKTMVRERLLSAQTLHHYRTNTMIRTPIPFLGMNEPLLSDGDFFLETPHDLTLASYDSFGKEQWRMPVPSAPQNNMYHPNYLFTNYNYNRSDYTNLFLKANHHFIVLVYNDSLIAYDTFSRNEDRTPKCLWTRKASMPLSGRTWIRTTPMNNFQSKIIVGDIVYSQNTTEVIAGDHLHIAKNTVYYCDFDKLYAIDSLTGDVRWERLLPSNHCTLVGDRDSVFVIVNDSRQVIAIDLESGDERGTAVVPTGCFVAYGTKLLVQQNQNNLRSISVADLREMLDKKRTSRTPFSLTLKVLQDRLAHNTLVRMFDGNRYLGIVSLRINNDQKTERTLRLFDLDSSEICFSDQSPDSKPTGLPLCFATDAKPENNYYAVDFHIEFVDDRLLVLLIDKTDITNQNKPPIINRQPLQRIPPSRPVGSATMMMYDKNGKKVWNTAYELKNEHWVDQIPKHSPIALFACSGMENREESVYSTFLLGIDKRTGEKRLGKIIPSPPHQQRQQEIFDGFRMEIDPSLHKISLVSSTKTVALQFTNDAPDEAAPANQKNKQNEIKKTDPLSEFFENLFNL